MFCVGQGPIECNSEVLEVYRWMLWELCYLHRRLPYGVLPCSLSGESNCSLFFQHYVVGAIAEGTCPGWSGH